MDAGGRGTRLGRTSWLLAVITAAGLGILGASKSATAAVETCDILVVGGGLAGVATAHEALHAGRTVCLTEMTDWLGGQLSAQGTTALDEAQRQRQLLFYAAGYLDLRQRVQQQYGRQNPGDCWVSALCFLPEDAHAILNEMLTEAARAGGGTLRWFPNTVVKELAIENSQIQSAIAIQHRPAPGTPPLHTEPLSAYLEDAYRYEDSARLTKRTIQLQPTDGDGPTGWYVIEATETGEIVALAGVPHRLGLDPRSHLNPSSPVQTADPYCTQGFTYTFAMERTAQPQPQSKPAHYETYAPYFSFERRREGINYIDFVFTYRRLWAPLPRTQTGRIFGVSVPHPGDISMQNWTWGNDYRPGTEIDNLIYTSDQLAMLNQLEPGGWLGGLRIDSLRRAEEHAFSYYYWLVAGTTDSQLGNDVKQPAPNHRLLRGFDAPMNTAHGLSKYPYIREARRIIGRPAYGHPEGFAIHEIDISRSDYGDSYRSDLVPDLYRSLRRAVAGLDATAAIAENWPPTDIPRRTRSTIYPDAVGISHYAIDFHPCMALSPPERPGNTEREGVRRAHGQSYPGQIPLRAMIPQNIDNLLVTGKSIATSTAAAAAYRVHGFEWAAGTAAGATADFALEQQLLPYTLVDELPRPEPQLEQLQRRLQQAGNPIAFPQTSIFNLDWEEWRVW